MSFIFVLFLVLAYGDNYGGFLPDMILLTQCCYQYYLLGNPIKCHEEVLFLQPMIPPKHFDIHWGMLRKSRCIQLFR